MVGYERQREVSLRKPVHSHNDGRPTHPLDVVPQRVTLDDLLRLVPVDDRLETVEGPAPHDVAHALLLDAEPLDLVVDVEEQRVVARGVV